MRKIYLFVAIILILGVNFQNPAQVNDLGKKISLIEVIVPFTEIYDDGLYRKLYASYQIFDSTGTKVLGVSEKYDRPVQVKLPEGNYKFLINLSNGNLLEKDFNVVGNQFKVIKVKWNKLKN